MGVRRSVRAVRGNRWLSSRGRRTLGVALVSGSGALLSFAAALHVLRMSSLVSVLLVAGLPLALAVGVVAFGLWLWRSPLPDASVLRIAGWVLIGMAGLGVLFLWILAHHHLRGVEFVHAQFVLANSLIAGSVFGIAIGLYDVRGRRYRRQLEGERRNLTDERTKLAFLNRMLRHHVLNGLNIIIGHAQLIAEHVDDEGREHLTVIRDQSDDVSEFVQELRNLTRALVADPEPEPRDLSAVLERRVAVARRAHERADVTAEIPDDALVVADDMLELVFENLLTNAIVHNDGPAPSVDVAVDVRAETVVVRIADDGPGIPDELKETMFEWETKREESDGAGIGLAIVDTLVDRYGGSVWFEDNEPAGVVAAVELPRAAPADETSEENEAPEENRYVDAITS